MYRTAVTLVLLLQAAASCGARAQVRSVEGIYRNPALGYSISVPQGLKGVTGDQAGPERGIRISLPSGGEIVVYGEPNSAEYRTPEEGVAEELNPKGCNPGQREIKSTAVGKLTGAGGTLVCEDRVRLLLLVFRPHGGPIYWLGLKTTRQHEAEDKAILNAVAASFKLIRWE